jgi:nicotinamidase-related amidase
MDPQTESPKYASLVDRPALLIVDMQNDFLTSGGRLYNAGARDLIPPINALAATARAQGVPVVWVIQEHRRQLVDFGREADISPFHCVEGTAGAALAAGLERQDTDFTVIKRRYSGFYATDLDLLLRCLDRNRVVVTGINSDGCVLATALDAHARDYRVTVVTDATGAGVAEAQAAALGMLGRMQPGVVSTVAEVRQQWEALSQGMSETV